MSVEVIADCDECNDKISLIGNEKVFCETCHDRELRELGREIWELQDELRRATAMIAHLESRATRRKDERRALMEKYGSQTTEVEALLEKIKTITPEQAKALDAPWDAPWKAVWGAVWTAVWGAGREAGREAALEAALEAAWVAVRETAWDAGWVAVRDAVLVTVTKDLISEEDFHTLYSPWASVMEPQN